ncbi:exonuclease VII small subunit [Candidatus Terasakiella magnetica]|uniref:Exodeoxyribonuclease 7 small subunit n=1 Tax=Candidatus Terasakiella magnetica TaxID=1867952 RepID=A0A1C3RK61_9PROT|nr:exodeoxyribonuclease VII small subunit [Candidatus Terasakiella magnetica]SCA57682.1 exonuclease VII small subunit [Candidatus Terasakiella magnetica]
MSKSEIDALSFEEALAQLEEIVRQLESGSGKLDDAITAYEKGAMLKRHCEAKLAEAKAKVDKISLAPDGSVTAQPTEIS